MARKRLRLEEEVFLKIKVSSTSSAIQNIHGFRVSTEQQHSTFHDNWCWFSHGLSPILYGII